MGALTLVPLGARLDARRARPRARARAFAASASSGRYSLGLDVGTQGTKAILYDLETHEVAGRGALSYGLLPAPGRPNAAEQDPETWMEGIRVSVAAALESARAVPEDIAAVGVSGQQHGLVCLDARGDVIRPAKLWCDTESAAEADELGAVFGWAMQAGFTSSKALWLKRNEPDAWDATCAVLLPHDYVNYRLTGVLAMEAGDASGVGVMDLTTRAFRSDWCDAVDPKFASTLPDLRPPDVSLGETVGDATSTLGVPAGVPVSVGSGDNMMSAIGAGCVSEGRLVVSLGTSGTLFGYSDAPVFDPTGAVAPFCDATGGYLPLLCTMNCTRVAEEAREAFGAGMSHDDLAALACDVPAGSDGVRFLPYLVGERSPNWPGATGALTGIRPKSLASPGVMYRAAVEGATYSLLAGARRMRELGLPAPTELAAVGGGSKSKFWRQIVADVFDARVKRPTEPESAALGAAMQAAATLEGAPVRAYVDAHPPPYAEDEETPNEDAVKAHAENYRAFVADGEALFGR